MKNSSKRFTCGHIAGCMEYGLFLPAPVTGKTGGSCSPSWGAYGNGCPGRPNYKILNVFAGESVL